MAEQKSFLKYPAPPTEAAVPNAEKLKSIESDIIKYAMIIQESLSFCGVPCECRSTANRLAAAEVLNAYRRADESFRNTMTALDRSLALYELVRSNESVELDEQAVQPIPKLYKASPDGDLLPEDIGPYLKTINKYSTMGTLAGVTFSIRR